MNVLYSQLLHEPQKLAIIGGGCSIATEPTAEVSHYYNITQVSPQHHTGESTTSHRGVNTDSKNKFINIIIANFS